MFTYIMALVYAIDQYRVARARSTRVRTVWHV